MMSLLDLNLPMFLILGVVDRSFLGSIRPAGSFNLAHTVVKKSKHLKLGAFPLKSGYLAAFERSEDLATPDLHRLLATKAGVEWKRPSLDRECTSPPVSGTWLASDTGSHSNASIVRCLGGSVG